MARHQHRRTVSDVFNIEVAGSEAQLCAGGAGALDQPIFTEANKCSPSSSSSDFQSTSDSNFLLREDAAYRRRKELYYHRTNADGGKQNQSIEQDDGEVHEADDDGIREFADDDGDAASQFETSVVTSDCSKATVSRVAVDVSGLSLARCGDFAYTFRSFSPRRAFDDGPPTSARVLRTTNAACTTRRSGLCRRGCRKVSILSVFAPGRASFVVRFVKVDCSH